MFHLDSNFSGKQELKKYFISVKPKICQRQFKGHLCAENRLVFVEVTLSEVKNITNRQTGLSYEQKVAFLSSGNENLAKRLQA